MSKAEAYFSGKKITLMGLGLLGRGVGDARFLAQCDAELLVTDLKSKEQLAESLEQLKEFPNITYRLGEHVLEDFQNRDLILKAAGVPRNSSYIAEAKKNHIPVRMSADLFVEISELPTVAITGTRGKSTVTHMIAHILKTAGKDVLLGGNVRGVSTLALLPQVTPRSIAVLELDSWQLQGFGDAGMAPQVGVFTTFYPDHMNYYGGSMEQYFADKANIFLHQTESDTFVLGEQVAPFVKEFGYQNKIKAHTEVVGAKNLPKNTTLQIPGEHNRYNAALAQAAAAAFGIEEEIIKTALESFEGVEGRLQFMKEVRGVKIYNDNNATTPDATIAALRAFGDSNPPAGRVVLIMGGSDKGLNMQPLLEEIPKHCKQVFMLDGAGTERINDHVMHGLIYQTMHDVVTAAFAACVPGDILLFSPAFASFGMFKNEYDRNDQFVAAVASLA